VCVCVCIYTHTHTHTHTYTHSIFDYRIRFHFKVCPRDRERYYYYYYYYYYIIELKKGGLPGGSGPTIRHNTQKFTYHTKLVIGVLRIAMKRANWSVHNVLAIDSVIST
jgi:hypothetical protein